MGNLRSVHMAEQGPSEEDWHAKAKQVYDSEEARAVKGEFFPTSQCGVLCGGASSSLA